MKNPFKRVTLHFREIALLREMIGFCDRNGFWNNRMKYEGYSNSRTILEKLVHRLNKHYRKLLAVKSEGSCTGCGASPYREYRKS